MKVTLNKKGLIIFIYIFVPLLLLSLIYALILAYLSDDMGEFYFLTISFIVIVIIVYCSLRSGSLTQFVEISKEGVKYISEKRKYTMRWEDMSFVGITEYRSIGPKTIVFCRVYDLHLLKVPFHYSRMSNEFIFIFLRKGVLEEIKKYWKGEIINGDRNKHKRYKKTVL